MLSLQERINDIKAIYGKNPNRKPKHHLSKPPRKNLKNPSFSFLFSPSSSPPLSPSSSSSLSPSSSSSSLSPSLSSFDNEYNDWLNQQNYTEETNYKLPSFTGDCNRSDIDKYSGCKTYNCYDRKKNIHSYGYDCDWKQYYDPKAAAKYYYNEQTGEATWVKPDYSFNGGLKKHKSKKLTGRKNKKTKKNLRKKNNKYFI